MRLQPGPKKPCAPNSNTKTRPEITGLTENGRSISAKLVRRRWERRGYGVQPAAGPIRLPDPAR